MRSLHRLPPFHVLVVGMLAVGIGASTAIFSLVNGVLLQPLPFPDPQQLMLVSESAPQMPGFNRLAFFNTPSAFVAWQAQATDFQALAAVQGTSFTLTGEGEPRVLDGVRVTPNFFDVLQATPELGRFFAEADASDNSRPIVITDSLWRSAFNADPRVVGRTVGSPGQDARVIGVLPARFRIGGSELGPVTSGRPTEFFVPFAFGLGDEGDLRSVWTNFNYAVIGRLRPMVPVDRALAQLNTIQARLAAAAPDPAPGMTLGAQIVPVIDYATRDYHHELWLLLAAVGAVLLIITVNLGGLWVTRVVDRRRDWAIRVALGAEPGRLVWHVLNEGLVLGLIGGTLGVASAAAGLEGLLALAPKDIPRLGQVHVDLRVLVVGLLLSAAAGLLTGAVPAVRVGRGDPRAFLSGASRSTTGGPASVRSRQWLIGLQAALTTLLIAVAGLLGFSLHHLMTRSAGFSTDHAVKAEVVISTYGSGQREQILRSITTSVAAIPGVQAAGLTSHLPLEGETWIDGVGAPGRQYSKAQQPRANVRFVGGGYFSAMQIPLIAGRDFEETDRPAGWPPKNRSDERAMHESVIISQATARLVWPGRDPQSLVGEPITLNGLTPTIVGVTADALDGTLNAAPPPVIYQPYWSWDPATFSLVLRTSLPVSAIAAPLRAAVWALAPNSAIPEIKPLSSLRADATATQRYQFALVLVFAGLAVTLGAIGVYALVAHSVAQRRKELAIRLALGAPTSTIRALIAAQAITPVGMGAFLGVTGALAGGRLLQSMLYGVGAGDPPTLIVAVAVVLLAGSLACVAPARRATRVDPNEALRAE